MYKTNAKKVFESDLRAKMLEIFKETQMQFELQTFHDRQKWMKSDPLAALFLSSRLKTAIYHYFKLKGFSHGHTVSSISKALSTDRSTISRLLTECHQKGYIYRNKSPKKRRYYLPATELLENGKWYAEYIADQILSMENELERRLFVDYKRMEKISL